MDMLQRIRRLVPEAAGIEIRVQPQEELYNTIERELVKVGSSWKDLPKETAYILGTGVFATSKGWINVAADYSGILNDMELRAIVLHEVGHVKACHLEKKEKTEFNPDYEVEADAYALECGVTKRDLWDAVTKMSVAGVALAGGLCARINGSAPEPEVINDAQAEVVDSEFKPASELEPAQAARRLALLGY
jgi:hypothetical protein